MTGRRLILIRHAKADAGVVDLERPLTARGESDAAAAGRLLARAGAVPDRAVLSPARRARQTWEAVQAGLAEPVEAVIDERIWDNDVAALFQVVAEAEADAGAAIAAADIRAAEINILRMVLLLTHPNRDQHLGEGACSRVERAGAGFFARLSS